MCEIRMEVISDYGSYIFLGTTRTNASILEYLTGYDSSMSMHVWQRFFQTHKPTRKFPIKYKTRQNKINAWSQC